MGVLQRTSISIADHYGQPVSDAVVRIEVDGEPAGELRPGGRPGPYTLEIDRVDGRVELIVAQGGRDVAREQIAPGQALVSFVVTPVRRLRTAERLAPFARCPDGTVGAPCVTCTVGSRKVRICV